MGLNGQMGLGILLEGKDLASGVLGGFGRNLLHTKGISEEATAAIGGHMRALGVGMGVMAAGVAGLASLSPASEAAKQYGAAIAEVTTLTDEAVFPTEKMRQATMGLAATYGLNAIQQAKGLYQTISAGVTDAAKATDTLTVANKFAIGGKTSVFNAVDAITTATNAYSESQLTAADAADTFFIAIRGGKTTAEELAGFIGHAAPLAAKAGVSFQELNAAIAATTISGINTRIAMSGMSAILENILKPSADATAEAGRLGIKFDQASLKSKGFAGMLGEITGNAKFNDKTLIKLFGSVEALRTVLAITTNGSAKFNGFMKDMETRAGATDVAFQKMANTSQFQEQRFNGLKKNALILIGEAIEPAIVAVTKFANRILEAFNSLPAPVRNFLVQGFALVSVLTTVVGGAVAARAAFGLLRIGMAALGVSAGGALAALWPVVLVLGVAALAFVAFRHAFEHNLGGFGDFVGGAVAKVQLGFQALGQLFSDGGFSGAVRDELNKADNAGLKNFVVRVYVTVARIQHMFEELGKGFGKVIDAAGPSFKRFVDALDELGEAFGGLTGANDAEKAAGTYKSFGSTGEKLGEILGKLAVGIVDLATVMVKIVTAVVNVSDKFGGFGNVITAVGIAFVGAKIASGLDGIGASSIAAKGEIGLVIASLMALYKAYTLFQDLDKQSHGQGWSMWWTNAKHNLHITSDEEYNKQKNALTGDDKLSQQEIALRKGYITQEQFDSGYRQSHVAELSAEASRSFVSVEPPAFPAAVAQQAQQEAYGTRVEPADLTAAVASGVKQSPVPNQTIIVQIGDEKVAEAVSKAQSSADYRSGAPVLASF